MGAAGSLMHVYAHRGRNRLALENTIPAFLLALDDTNIDGIELDVQLARCGTPVVFHDDTLDRLFGVEGTTRDFTAEQLKDFHPINAEHYVAQPSEMVIPTLLEVLEAIPDGPLINIEIKAPTIQKASATAPTAHVMAQLRRNYLVSCFNPVELARFSKISPKVPRALLFDADSPYLLNRAWPVPLLSRFGGLSAIHPNWRLISPDLIERARERGMRVHVWTVNDPERAAWLDHEGVDGIITDVL